jgi:hypothetical protein
MFLYGPIETDGRVQRSIMMLQQNTNIDITLISCGSNKQYEIDNISHVIFDIKIGGLYNYFKFLIKSISFILKNKYDIYYFHDFFTIFISFFISKRSKIIYDAHELIVPKKK